MEEQNLTFQDLGLSDAMLKALEKKGYGYPTTIQLQAIPHFLQWKGGVPTTGPPERSQGYTLLTSFNLNCLLKTLSPNTVILGIGRTQLGPEHPVCIC